MPVKLDTTEKVHDLTLMGVFAKAKSAGATPSKWPKNMISAMNAVKGSKNFKGENGKTFTFNLPSGRRVIAVGLGEKKDYKEETLRRVIAPLCKCLSSETAFAIDLESFSLGDLSKTTSVIGETLLMSQYDFNKYKDKRKPAKEGKKKPTVITLKAKATNKRKLEVALSKAHVVGESINFCRDLVNEPPNVLHSENYARIISADAKKISGVKVKILGREDLKREKMEMFLSVNAGSAYKPQLVHLTYNPTSKGRKKKHIALVGKGVTFDTGGYSLKPAAHINNMKYDMAGSATVYAAFRAAAMLKLPIKVSCFLAITDNAVNEKATLPDSIVTARNGKTVEILNTDAEGRLILGDTLDYACEQKPDAIIDAATLTGAVLLALGSEVCGVMGNNRKLTDNLIKSATAVNEYMWELPIIKEFHSDIKSNVADLKNIGGNRLAGSAKAGAFLENFVDEKIPWAHLDIAGVADAQGYLPYCPSKGASGLMVRSLVHFLSHA